jgi:hypothetical protein
MGKIEHLQFLVLLIPTFVILGAAAVSMADLALPATEAPHAPMTVAVGTCAIHAGELSCDHNLAE